MISYAPLILMIAGCYQVNVGVLSREGGSTWEKEISVPLQFPHFLPQNTYFSEYRLGRISINFIIRSMCQIIILDYNNALISLHIYIDYLTHSSPTFVSSPFKMGYFHGFIVLRIRHCSTKWKVREK